MKKKIVSVLNWLKTRKTAFLSCLLVVCLGCSLIAVKRSNKQASAAVSGTSLTDVGYFIQTSLPPVLAYPGDSGSGQMCTFAFAPCFYITSTGLRIVDGADYFNISYSAFGKMGSESSDPDSSSYYTYMYNDTQSSSLVTITGRNIRLSCYRYVYQKVYGVYVTSWDVFYNELLLGNYYDVTLDFLNEVYYDKSVTFDSSAPYYKCNYLVYQFYFQHKNNVGYDFQFYVYISSMNEVKNYNLFSSGYHASTIVLDGFTYLQYFGFSTSFVGASDISDQYEVGYNTGKQVGIEVGTQKGYIDGRSSGLTEGEAIGYEKGLNENLSNITPWQVIVDGVNSFLNLEILPSVKISVILSVAFGLVLLGLAIKIFLGG